MTDPVRISCLGYSALLFLYPASLRRHFGEEMVQVFGDEISEAYLDEGWGGVARTWARAAREVLLVALPGHLRIVGLSLVSGLGAGCAFLLYSWVIFGRH
jgi:hypothetical protein